MALSVGKEKEFLWREKAIVSAIGKTQVKEVKLTVDGFVGDGVANPSFHGGPDRAVCYYPFEHYAKWEKEFNTKLKPPVFGENVCGTGFIEKDTYIGDIFSLGTAVVQITQGRIPCSTISQFNGINTFLPKIVETCLTGYFLRVLEEGIVREDSELQLIERMQEEYNVLEATKIMLLDKKNYAAMEKLLLIPSLAEDWRNRYQKAMSKLEKISE